MIQLLQCLVQWKHSQQPFWTDCVSWMNPLHLVLILSLPLQLCPCWKCCSAHFTCFWSQQRWPANTMAWLCAGVCMCTPKGTQGKQYHQWLTCRKLYLAFTYFSRTFIFCIYLTSRILNNVWSLLNHKLFFYTLFSWQQNVGMQMVPQWGTQQYKVHNKMIKEHWEFKIGIRVPLVKNLNLQACTTLWDYRSCPKRKIKK